MPTNVIGNSLSATTANILFDGVKIGTLQDIVVDEDYNIKPIDQIGSSFVTEFLPGTVSCKITAKRAVLEGDLFFDKLTPALNATNGLAQVISNYSDGNFELDTQTKLNLEGLNALATVIFSGKAPRDRLNFVVYFDVELLNANDEVFMKCVNCIIKSRRLNVSLNSVVIMQDLTILFRNRSI